LNARSVIVRLMNATELVDGVHPTDCRFSNSFVDYTVHASTASCGWSLS
jgi:hypothetical protein